MTSLCGLWSPKPERVWPRLVFTPGGLGYFEDGDDPVIYSVLHFEFQIRPAGVLCISNLKCEVLRNDRRATEWLAESSAGEFEFGVDDYPASGNALLTFKYQPYPFGFRQFRLASREVATDYKPEWRFIP